MSTVIIQKCKDNEIAFVGDFPEGRLAISESQKHSVDFMNGCQKLYTFPDFKEISLS